MAWAGASTEEHEHQQALLKTLLRWCLFVAPLATAVNVAVYLYNPIWPALVLVMAGAAVLAVAAWSLPRVRRGELRFATRAMLTLFLVMVTINALAIDERVKAMALLGLPCIILLAIALEPPALALGWAYAAIAAQVASDVVPRVTALPTMRISTVLVRLFDFGTFELLLLITLLGRSIMRHLREALSASEHARAAVEKSNARLAEQRATLEKAQADLASSTRSLEASNRELQRFAAVVSHDLLAPVRALEGDTQRLQERYAGQLDADGREHLAGISESARHMDALVTGLLAYSSAGQPRAELEPVDLGALLERVATALHLRSRADVSFPADLPTLRAHRLRLEQVFANLLENAVKFQRPGVRPQVTVERLDRGDAWELAVRDNGIGIEPRHFEKIFGIFQRLHLQSEYEGTGIGLAIVQKAIEEHGGKVWVESAPGQGSTFHFTLPKPREARAGAPGDGAASEVETSPAVPRLMPVQEEVGRPGDELELTEEGARIHRASVTLGLLSILVTSPVYAMVYMVPFVRRPTWEALPTAAAGALGMAVSAWGLWRVRRGNVLLPTRAFLAVMFFLVIDHVLYREDEVLVTGSLGCAGLLVMATALERPALALRWTWGGGGLYLAALVLRRSLPLRSLDLGPLAMDVARFIPVVELLFVLIIGLALMRLLRQALARSRAARSELERANASLQRQRVELLQAQARLSTLADDLTRSNRELRSFAYVASHDLRAPLRALNHYSRFLQEDCAAQLDEAGRQHLERIAAAARKMDALVAELLEYSRAQERT